MKTLSEFIKELQMYEKDFGHREIVAIKSHSFHLSPSACYGSEEPKIRLYVSVDLLQ